MRRLPAAWNNSRTNWQDSTHNHDPDPLLGIHPFTDLGTIEYLSFDCYGTLIDWESGIATALGPVLDARGTPMNREALLELYAEIEPEVESRPPFRTYRQILTEVVDEIGRRLGWQPTAEERVCLADALPD